MSLSALLVPLAIALLATAENAREGAIKASRQPARSRQPIPSRFRDNNLLKKTLEEHGVDVEEVSKNRINARFADGSLSYIRNNSKEAFSIDLSAVECIDALIEELDQIAAEYASNVQGYTYKRVKENLPEEMAIEKEEVLDDNSILITLTVE